MKKTCHLIYSHSDTIQDAWVNGWKPLFGCSALNVNDFYNRLDSKSQQEGIYLTYDNCKLKNIQDVDVSGIGEVKVNILLILVVDKTVQQSPCNLYDNSETKKPLYLVRRTRSIQRYHLARFFGKNIKDKYMEAEHILRQSSNSKCLFAIPISARFYRMNAI